MQIETTSLTPVLHLVLSGRFDSESAASFEQMVTNNWSEGVRELRLTMTGVDYISSMGVRELVLAGSANARFAVAAASPRVRSVLSVSGLQSWLVD
jgi:anti-sigma B factor antagonist/stage II sporulation protein AA (anti-sigma F factor antagonist)